MSATPHEDRFIDVLQCLIGHELAQEISMPRKVRRLDAMCRFDLTPVPTFFGALRAACADRVVIFEHESAALTAEAIASAWVGQAWVSWQRLKKQRGRQVALQRLIEGTRRPPLTIVVADMAAGPLHGVIPTLGQTSWPGLWATADTGGLQFDEGGLLVIDTSHIPSSDGFSFWRWLGRASDAEDAIARLLALLGDPLLPIVDKSRFLEAMMDNQFPVSAPEKETASQQVRREGREEGREEGERHTLLAVAARFAPDALPTLGGITELDTLRRAVDEALSRTLGR